MSEKPGVEPCTGEAQQIDDNQGRIPAPIIEKKESPAYDNGMPASV